MLEKQIKEWEKMLVNFKGSSSYSHSMADEAQTLMKTNQISRETKETLDQISESIEGALQGSFGIKAKQLLKKSSNTFN